MKKSFRFAAAAAVSLLALSASALADGNRLTVQVSADDPFYGLPALSDDGAFVALPVRREATPTCFGDVMEVWIESTLAAKSKAKPQIITLADGCKTTKGARYDERRELMSSVPELNDMLQALRFKSMVFHRSPEGVEAPFEFQADDVLIKVKGKKNKVDVEAKLGKKGLGKKSLTTKVKKVKTGSLVGLAIVRVPGVKPMAFVQVEWMIPGKTSNSFVTEWQSFDLKGLPIPVPQGGDRF